MREIKVRLVKDYGEQKFYELSSPIKKGRYFYKDVDIENSLREEFRNVSDKYKESFSRECKIICVSDAHTHIERLVFAGHRKGDEFYRSHTVICGVNTMMINGGDITKIYDINVYLRFLGRLNNVKLTLLK